MDKAEETKREQADQENAETPKVEDVEVEFPSPRDLIHDYDVEWDPNKFEPEDVKLNFRRAMK